MQKLPCRIVMTSRDVPSARIPCFLPVLLGVRHKTGRGRTATQVAQARSSGARTPGEERWPSETHHYGVSEKTSASFPICHTVHVPGGPALHLLRLDRLNDPGAPLWMRCNGEQSLLSSPTPLGQGRGWPGCPKASWHRQAVAFYRHLVLPVRAASWG